MRKLLVVPALLLLSLCGCKNTYQDSLTTAKTIGQIITIAQNALPGFEATGIFSANEGAVATGWLAAASTLDTQAISCINSAGTSAKAAALLACFNTFAQGLVTPAELAQLRILNPKAQQQVQIWVTAVQLALNVTIQELGGTGGAPPQVAMLPAPATDHAARSLALAAYSEAAQ